MISFLRAHKRLISFSLVAFCAFWLAPSWEEGIPFQVNRGIGTTGFPIRLGARPEITVFELVRGV